MDDHPNYNLPFLKKLYYLIVILLLCSQGMQAQELIGKITDVDSAHSPLFLAEVVQMQNGKIIATYKTYFDGTYRIKVKPDQTYQIKASFPGRSDTTVTISIDKHGTLYSGTLFLSLPKDGLRLTGFVMDAEQDIPIKDATLILRNVMTRKEDRIVTDGTGAYNLKMDYETNYSIKIDKMSPGIINKYRDTSFNISTIGFNKPLDFRLDIKLGPATGHVTSRPEYDPHAAPDNKNLKPALGVYGAHEPARRRQQDSLVAALNLQMSNKDSVIASLDKRLSDIKSDPKILSVDTAEQRKQEEAKMKLEVENRKKELMEQQKRKDMEKAEADLKAKKQAEKELQDKLDKENKEAEARKLAKPQIDTAALRMQAEEDSLLRIAKDKNNQILARRKHILDSLNTAENKKSRIATQQAKKDRAAQEIDSTQIKAAIAKKKLEEADRARRDQLAQDSMLRVAELKNKSVINTRKQVLDSLIDIESQKTKIKTDNRGTNQANNRDSAAILAEMVRRAQASRMQAEEDSLLKIAMAKNREIMARRKRIADSLAVIDKENIQAKFDAKKLESEKEAALKEKEARELAEKQAREKALKDGEEKERAEIAETERRAKELADLKKAKADKERADKEKAEKEAADRKTQLEKELAEMKKAREDAEAKILADKREKEEADKKAKEEAKRAAKDLADQAKKKKRELKSANEQAEEKKRIEAKRQEAENEQRELEAKRTLQEQEKNQLKQQLINLQKDEQATVTKDQEAKNQDYNPDQAHKADQAKAINTYEVQKLTENKRRADSMTNTPRPQASQGGKLIRAKGFVKNSQTEDPIPNVSINIRRLNSVVSQEATSDANGRYDIVVDSGYFYLVSYYKDKFEISKQILDLTTYAKADYNMVIQYLKERDDFDPNAKMPVIQFDKNSSKLPGDVWGGLESIVKMMKEIPELKIKLYGLASLDEDYPMELSVTRARLVADLMLESGIKPSRIRINGIGAYRPRSGCTEGKACDDKTYKLDRVVMYKVVKE